MARLDGKGVLVTGGSRGIGRALAERMGTEGARVVVTDLDSPDLHETADAIGAHPVAADLSSEQGVRDVVDAARAHLGRVDVVYANAGISVMHGLLDTTEEEWRRAVDINLMAHVRLARALVPGWLEDGEGGRFVVTASAAGLLTMLGEPSYSVTKHGAVAFAEWLSATYRHRGVVVQAICPQGVRTRMLEESGDAEELLSADGALEPAQVAEVAAAALDDDRFLVLPHPQVAGYYAMRATDTDRWLAAMSRLQQAMERP